MSGKHKGVLSVTLARAEDGRVVSVRPGYQFLDHRTVVLVDGERLSNDNLTHAKALRLMVVRPGDFRDTIVRGWYPLDDPYWNE